MFGGIFQRVKKAMCDSLGLVDFAIGLVNPVLNLLKGQSFFVEIQKAEL